MSKTLYKIIIDQLILEYFFGRSLTALEWYDMNSLVSGEIEVDFSDFIIMSRKLHYLGMINDRVHTKDSSVAHNHSSWKKCFDETMTVLKTFFNRTRQPRWQLIWGLQRNSWQSVFELMTDGNTIIYQGGRDWLEWKRRNSQVDVGMAIVGLFHCGKSDNGRLLAREFNSIFIGEVI